jgi:tetratricopeptide (TPR) repeat protein
MDPPEPRDPRPPDAAQAAAGNGSGPLSQIDHWQQYLVAVAALFTVVAQLWSAVENQWKLATVTLTAALVLGALYALAHRAVRDPKMVRLTRALLILFLIAVPLCSMVGLFMYSYLPRLVEKGTRVAVARFVGPKLPAPYDDCRPSDMLVHTLSQIGNRFGLITPFELPYSIDPDNRWARWWTRSHGLFEAADVLVYGEYTLRAGPDGKPDEIVLHPEVDQIPKIPLTDKTAPLYSWDLHGSVGKIDEICNSGIRDAGKVPPFLDYTRRLTLAIVGAQLLGAQRFEEAEEALREAKTAYGDESPRCSVDPPAPECPGVLNFYLATLDQRLGHYPDAEREYRYAASVLHTAAPLINLGELYMQTGHPQDAFVALDRAVAAEPNSIAALATRALYEWDYDRPRQAAVDLDRSLRLPTDGLYDDIALSRALYQRGGSSALPCGLKVLDRAVHRSDFDGAANVDTLVRYGMWLRAANRRPEALESFEKALRYNPQHIKANYQLARALEDVGTSENSLAQAYFRRAVYPPAYTDEDFLDRANAAAELVNKYDGTDARQARSDRAAAMAAYTESTVRNRYAVYAYWDRARLEVNTDNRAAEEDFRAAAALHPYDPMILSSLAQFLGAAGRRAESDVWHAKAAAALKSRIPAADSDAWSGFPTCRYEHMDV